MYHTIYKLSIYFLGFGMRVASIFHPKAKLWVNGRKNVFTLIKDKIKPDDKVIWMHASSLGEYEQGLPVLTALKERYPDYKFAISFFSPSGFEVVKDNTWADLVFYLPLDTAYNAEMLIKNLHPEIAIFVKYDFWYNLLIRLSSTKIPIIFISSVFRENQIYFKPVGKWMVSVLKNISCFFVQDEKSKILLKSIGIEKVIVSGDTRFDRVKMLLNRDNHLSWLEKFKDDHILLVAGSTWKEDDIVLEKYVNLDTRLNCKWIIAPHNMDVEHIKNLKSELKLKTILYTEIIDQNLDEFEVLILDTVGLLTKVYSYADIAYVGGAFGKEGVHNVLEPAVFGSPVIFGPVYHKFIEAEELIQAGGAITIQNQSGFDIIISDLLKNKKLRNKIGHEAQNYVLSKPNSTQLILNYLESFQII
ncbi:3-deoxy-D-manno-octulosonic acid transferase [Apibacter sp. HY039]|uniref:3-deoxy-D-manno-octulosonic acid transferase n=1 Tax=Apibacter sp. HY039 TaxID=2501476 RepID=UPI000FEBEA2E|nr:glycosyltransferase N-terminal domain-containing protein [Apibacter sp. HY039]